jgi:hypothetical protein
LRLLFQAAKAPEDLAELGEIALERIQNMADGALCSDETAYHLEQELQLPTGWLDRMNNEVPPRMLALLSNPAQKFRDESRVTPLVLTDDEQDSVNVSTSSVNASDAASDLAPSAEPLGVPKQLMGQTAAEQSALRLGLQALPVADTVASGLGGEQVQPAVALASAAHIITPANVVLDPVPTGSIPAIVEPNISAAAIPDSSSSALSPVLPSIAENSSMTPAELRLNNLNVLLSLKGSKSALARILEFSPAAITTMLNGKRSMDKEYYEKLAGLMKLPENWFERERSVEDIPAATKKVLTPLVRGANAPKTPKEVVAPVLASTAQSAESQLVLPSVSAPAVPVEVLPPVVTAASAPVSAAPRTWPAPKAESKVSKLQELVNYRSPVEATIPANGLIAGTEALAAPSLAPEPAAVEVAMPAPAKATYTAEPAPLAASPASAELPAPTAPRLAIPPTARELARAGDLLPSPVTGFAPITQALFKIMAQKALAGTLTEDKAFELLCTVRSL